jgi:TolB-like protein
VLLTTLAGTAQAAESLDAAVENIAQRFVDSQGNGEKPIRVAVTAFVQSDRKSTQFTNLLMIALTGKMVQLSKGKFRVIERAQLETALAEIRLSDVPIFDRNTAQELGKFLGVDALIVGEITPLSDKVRLDARMIEVETIETVEQAYDWVPLTPTVQRQLDTLAVVARPRVGDGNKQDPRNGIWHGTGTCGDSTVGLAVSIIATPDDKLSAMQVYFPSAQGGDSSPVQTGILSMAGTIDPATNAFKLLPGNWIFRPRGHTALGFSGTLDVNTGVISAKYDRKGCGEINLRKMN